ncbi:hypothetical protein ES703_16193 [subsurface metagenome]
MQSDLGGILFPAPDHIGVMVKDADKTIEFLSSILGLGPWLMLEESFDEMWAGEPFSVKGGHARLGSVVLEILQPLEKGSLWGQFVETKGEGLHHIAFCFPNWEETVAKLQEQGSKMLLGSRFDGKRFCFFETKPGGIIIEIGEQGIHDRSYKGL